MSPEQAKGAAALDARADVFSLGCVLYRCLTGRAAFSGDNPGAVLAKLLFSDRPRVSEWAPNVPPALDDLVARMLARSPADRPANAEQIATALGALGPLSDDRPRHTATIAEREQRLVCLLLATHGDRTSLDQPASDDEGTAVLSPLAPSEQSLASVVSAHGGAMEMFADGAVLVQIAGAPAATDLAARGARCALAMRTLIPQSVIAVTLGHSDSKTKLPTGGSIDQVDGLARCGVAAGTIVLDDATANLLDARFAIDKLARGTALRFARGTDVSVRQLLGKPTPCVGREREHAMMLATVRAAFADATPTALLVTAGPGMGKSRLCQEVLHDAGTVATWRARADALSQGSALALLGAVIRDAAAIASGEPGEDKLRAFAARYGADAEFVAEIARVDVARPSARLRAAREDATAMSDQLLRAWRELVDAVTARHPLVIALEDLQWGDHPSVRFVDAILRGPDRPLVVLAACRPEVHQVFPKLWADRRVQEIHLQPLSKKAREALIAHVLGDVDAAVAARIADRCEGNAFYLEELIRAVAEGKGDHLPESVLAMAEARFQRLEPAQRRVLRVASIFGETFWRGALAALMTADEWADVAHGLGDLVAREVIAPVPASRFAGEDELAFRHALIRDAAYEAIADSDRVAGHRLAGEWLEAHGERDAVVLGLHFERGGDPVRAREHYKRAAEQAFDGNDLDAVLRNAARAIACGAAGHQLGELRVMEAEVKGWHGKPAEQLPLAIEARANLPAATPHAFRAAEQIAVASCRTGNQDALREAAEKLCALDPAGTVTNGHMWPLARTVNQLILMGQSAHANRLVAHMETLRARVPADDHAARASIVFARDLAALMDCEPEPYLRDLDAIAGAYDDAGLARYAALQRFHVQYAYGAAGAFEVGLAFARDTLARTQQLELAIYANGTKAQLGWFLAIAGDHDAALALATEGLQYAVAVGQKLMEGNVRCRLAAIHELAGDLAAAEREARIASTMPGLALTFRADATARLAHLLLRLGRADEALPVSADAMRMMFPAGTIFATQLLAFRARADALAATGHDADAAAIRAEATAYRDIKAAKISDPALRASFVAAPENRP